MKQKSILLSFDIEEFDLPKEFGTEISAADQLLIAGAGTEKILDVIEKTGIRATFFVTGKFAEAFPELIARMTASGGEIASHGYDHSFFETAHLGKSAEILRKISGSEIRGFRMARLAPVKKEDILKAGFTYARHKYPVVQLKLAERQQRQENTDGARDENHCGADQQARHNHLLKFRRIDKQAKRKEQNQLAQPTQAIEKVRC